MAEAPRHPDRVHLTLRTRFAAAPNLLHHCPSFFPPLPMLMTPSSRLSPFTKQESCHDGKSCLRTGCGCLSIHTRLFATSSQPPARCLFNEFLAAYRPRTQTEQDHAVGNVHSEVQHHVISPSKPTMWPSSVHAVVIFARPA